MRLIYFFILTLSSTAVFASAHDYVITKSEYSQCGSVGQIITETQFFTLQSCHNGKYQTFTDDGKTHTTQIYDCRATSENGFDGVRCNRKYWGGSVVSYEPMEWEVNTTTCEAGQGTIFEDNKWNLLTYGFSIEACVNTCLFKSYDGVFCATADCTGDIIQTGDSCSFTGARNSVESVPSLCKRDTGNTGYLCPYDVNKNGYPDDAGQQFDPYATCGYDARDHFACTGGSYDHDGETTPPEDPDSELPESELPDLEIPEFDPPTDGSKPPVPPIETPDQPDVVVPPGQDMGGVISAITNQNRDINQNFSNLISANNTNFANLNTKLRDLNDNSAAINNNIGKQLLQDYEIYKREKEQREIVALALKDEIKKQNEALIETLTVNKDEISQQLDTSFNSMLSGQEETNYALSLINQNLYPIRGSLEELGLYSSQTSENTADIAKYTDWISLDTSDISSNTNKIKQLVNKVNKSLTSNTDAINSGFDALGTQLGEQTGAIVGALDGLSIEGDFSGLEGALADASNSISGAASSINGVASGLDELLDKLEPCVPTVENNYCENPHGLGESYISDALNQADSVVSGSVESWAETVTSAAEDMVNTDLTVESEAHISFLKDMALSVLPEPSSCQNLSLPTMMGKTVSIDCGFSEKLKMLFSILIYAFTIKALVEILLTEVVPVAGNKPSSGRYY